MGVSLRYVTQLTGSETLIANVPAAVSPVISHSGFNSAAQLNADSTPPVSKVAAFQITLSTGGAIDLTSLVGTNGAAVDGTGLRAQAIKIKGHADNAAAVVIAQGAANGYDGLGDSFSVALAGGAEVVIFTADAGADISGTNKILDLSGTDDDLVDVIIFMG